MTKKLAIMQPYFLPYIGYWQLINTVDEFIIYDDVNYISRGYVNRNYINTKTGKQRITLKLKKASINKHINEIETLGDVEDVIKTIHHTYRKSKYYEPTISVVEETIRNSETNLALYLKSQIVSICKFIGIDTSISLSSDMKNDKHQRGQHKILDMCKLKNVTQYINPIGGTSLYDKDYFAKNNIVLNFLKCDSSLNMMSIIDLLFTQGVDNTRKYLTRYALV